MTGYDATTLPRAAAVFGPQRIEYRTLHDLGLLLAEAGQMQAYLADLLRGEPVNKDALLYRTGYVDLYLMDLYVSLHLLEEVLGAHPIPDACHICNQYEERMGKLEKKVKEIESSRRYRNLWNNPYPTGTPQYDKREVLDMVCTIAAREAAQKEEKPNE